MPTKQTKETTPNLLKRVGASFAGSTDAGLASVPLTTALSNSLAKGEVGQRTSPTDVHTLKGTMGFRGITDFDPSADLASASYFGFNDRGVANIPGGAGPHVAAHEIGHGVLRRSMLGKGLALSRAAAPVGALGATIMSMTDPDSTTSKAAPVVAGLSTLPTLIDEGLASRKALSAMQSAGYDAASRALARKQLLKAFGTYGTQAGATLGGVMATRGIIKAMKKRGIAKEKTAMNSLIIDSFFDELEKIANLGGELSKTFIRKAPVLTSLPKIRPHVNPETILGASKSVAREVKTVGRARPSEAAAKAVESTRAGVTPKSVPQTRVNAPTPEVSPANHSGNFRRNLAIGGGLAAAGGMVGYAMPHRQRQ